VAGDEADQSQAGEFAAGAAGGGRGDAEFGGDLCLGGQLVARAAASAASMSLQAARTRARGSCGLAPMLTM
jgi:hypothetical protein